MKRGCILLITLLLMAKNLANVNRYVNKIKKGSIKNPFVKDCTGYLKILAETKDEEKFKIVVDSMCHFISKSTKGTMKYFKKEPLALVESFCEVTDHPGKITYNMFQAYRGLKVKKLPIGKTQKFFQKIYGSHFFKK